VSTAVSEPRLAARREPGRDSAPRPSRFTSPMPATELPKGNPSVVPLITKPCPARWPAAEPPRTGAEAGSTTAVITTDSRLNHAERPVRVTIRTSVNDGHQLSVEVLTGAGVLVGFVLLVLGLRRRRLLVSARKG